MEAIQVIVNAIINFIFHVFQCVRQNIHTPIVQEEFCCIKPRVKQKLDVHVAGVWTRGSISKSAFQWPKCLLGQFLAVFPRHDTTPMPLYGRRSRLVLPTRHIDSPEPLGSKLFDLSLQPYNHVELLFHPPPVLFTKNVCVAYTEPTHECLNPSSSHSPQTCRF